MPPRRRRSPSLPDYAPDRLQLADYQPRATYTDRSKDPASGYGWEKWDEPSPPLTARQKTQVIGAVGSVIFSGLISDSQYDIALPEAWRGDRRWNTIAAMQRDGQVQAVTAVCTLPLLQASYNINPGSDDQADVDVAQAVADNLLHGLQGGWHYLLRQFYQSRFRYGHYIGEKIWTSDENGIQIRRIGVRPPWTIYRWFPNAGDDSLDRIMQRVWMLDEGGVRGQWKFPVISAEKLLYSSRNQEANDYRGISLYYPMWTHWDYKHKLYLIDGIAAERNGMGVPTLIDPPLVRQAADRQLAAQALEAFRVGESAYMDLPNGYQFQLTAVSGAVRDVWPSIQHHDLLMSRSALAHFINLDAYGQLTISESAQTLFLSAEEAEGEEACEAFDLLIREWVDYNYEHVERYPTLAVTGIANRDLAAYLRGIAQLVQAGALTPNAEMENALRSDIGLPILPPEATVAGGDSPTVDPVSAGSVPTTPGTPAPARPQTPSSPGATQQLTRAAAPFAAGRLGERAIHLSGPDVRRSSDRFTLGFAQGRQRSDNPYASDDGEWLCLARDVVVGGHLIPNPNTGDNYDPSDTAIASMSHVLWRLGSGGKSGTHCPQCVYLSRRGLMRLDELHTEPGAGDTFCDDSCTCSLEYRRAVRVKVGKGG